MTSKGEITSQKGAAEAIVAAYRQHWPEARCTVNRRFSSGGNNVVYYAIIREGPTRQGRAGLARLITHTPELGSIQAVVDSALMDIDRCLRRQEERKTEAQERKRQHHIQRAAEDCYTVLKKWADFMRANYAHDDITWWDETEAAIAKAEGRHVETPDR